MCLKKKGKWNIHLKCFSFRIKQQHFESLKNYSYFRNFTVPKVF